MNYNCIALNASEPWCPIHTFANDSRIPIEYGYCNKKCNGQIPERSRPEHLGRSFYDNLWTTNLFSIHAWKAGVCHTYTPNETFYPGSEGHLYALIGDGMEKPRGSLSGYEIYLHDTKVNRKLFSISISISQAKTITFSTFGQENLFVSLDKVIAFFSNQGNSNR